jgi:peptidoglycan-associated lipoprotein
VNEEENDESIKPPENFSAFVVATVPLTQFVKRLPPVLRGTRFNVGLGRGRYVGYDGPNENLNTDAFFDDYHPETAIGLFGGAEVSLGSNKTIGLRDVALAIEYDSRDLNAALKTEIGPVTAAVVLHKIEGFDAGYDRLLQSDDKFERLGFGLSYTMDFPKRKPAPAVAPQPAPREPVPPAPVVTPPVQPTPPPAPAPEPAAPVAPLPPVSPAVGVVLNPIYYDYDQSGVRPDQRETARANANVLETHPDWKILVEGHCDERGTNEYNMALGQRRAESAKRYLVNLGISPARMTTVSFGEERPADPGHDETSWWKNRRAEFTLMTRE